MYESISPLEFRYLKSQDAKLRHFLSEEAFIKYLAKVEAALVAAYAKEGHCSLEIAEEIATVATEITAKEVYEEEARIHHQVRALVNCLKKRVSEKASTWIHLGATSHDIVCTADHLRYKEMVLQVLLPELIQLEKNLIELARREKTTLQIGRTHGQHAVVLTFGFAICEYVSRVGGRILKIKQAAEDLRGQFSGAVGAYNAQSLLIKDPIAFEQNFLNSIGLKPADHSTQIIEPEYVLDLIHHVVSTMGVLANFADDMRHLQRSEISEVAEKMSEDQVGSSTMPHKRNPIHFENAKSLWKVFMPRMTTMYIDQISEHQRDLSNSASSRFCGEILCGLYLMAKRIKRVTKNLVVDKEALEKNLQSAGEKILAEPLYILLAKNGHSDAHEIVRKFFHHGQGQPEDLLGENIKLPKVTEYIGKAIEKTEHVCKLWDGKLTELG